MARVLIVDDDSAFADGLAETIRSLGHDTMVCGSAAMARAAASSVQPNLVFLDLRLGTENGLALLAKWQESETLRQAPIVILTAFASADNTIEAMKLGAFDHLTKPVGRVQIEEVLSRALNRPLSAEPNLDRASDEKETNTFVGASSAMREVQKLVGLAAVSDASVLITGETGTGKEVIARALHAHSRRAHRAFVALNCAAIPAELLESELFGHVKGAFSGAVAPRLGKFREAHEGTLFLDEIGDMPLSMQSKLLRVLQERVITPVGGTGTQKVNVRLLAATHQDLVSRVRAGNFREDLYYRLNVVCITLPPLRERGGDIILLAEHFLKTAASEGTPKKLSSSACQALMAHRWPGNARELQNLMQRLTLMVRGPVITAADITLPETHGEHEPWSDLEEMDLSSALAKVERVLITKALASSGGNRTEAARRLGIHRQLLYAKIAEHKLG